MTTYRDRLAPNLLADVVAEHAHWVVYVWRLDNATDPDPRLAPVVKLARDFHRQFELLQPELPLQATYERVAEAGHQAVFEPYENDRFDAAA